MILLVDVDHTISDAGWRDGMLGDWDRYHKALIDDAPIQEVIDLTNELHISGWRIFLLTARPEKWRTLTEHWLMDHGVLFSGLLMRPDITDGIPSHIIKVKLVKERFPDLFAEPIILMDDRVDVCQAFAKLGITTFQVSARGNTPYDKEDARAILKASTPEAHHFIGCVDR